jgi:hypothetical protein
MQTQKSNAAFMAEILLLLGLLYAGWWYYSTNFAPGAQHLATNTSTTFPASMPGQHSVMGAPSLSADQVNAILAKWGSPAAGSGQTFYEQSLATGINDAWPMGFFWHESNGGRKGWAAVNKSIGNIRCTPGYSCNGGYRAYSSWDAGVTDWYALIKNLYIKTWGLVTVEQIVPRYAPPGDHNDVSAYESSVINTVSSYQGGQ